MKERIRITAHPRKEVDLEVLAHVLIEHLREQAEAQVDISSENDEATS